MCEREVKGFEPEIIRGLSIVFLVKFKKIEPTEIPEIHLYATNKKFSRQLPAVPYCWKSSIICGQNVLGSPDEHISGMIV